MKEFDELRDVVARLRGKNGCPWDKKQTHKTLKPYMVEEAYEALDAIDKGDPKKLRDELGDLLLQIMLHSQIAGEKGSFNIKDVARSIKDKMVRRHPHVFGKKKVLGIKEIWSNWEEIKKDEADYRSILDSIPKALPALYRAEKSQKKASRVGFDWDNVAGAWDKVEEELKEIKALLRSKGSTKKRLEEEIGDLLFSVVNVTRKTNISAENALHMATKKFSKRFLHIEQHAKKHSKKLNDMTLKQMDRLWNEAKKKS